MSWNARLTRAYNGRLRSLQLTLLEGALTNAVNASPQAVAIGVLPAFALVLQVAFRLNTQFTGGGATTVTATIGDTTGGASRYGAGLNLLGGSTSLVYLNPTTPGTFSGPNSVADTITVTVTPDAGHNLAALTAGSVDFFITYTVPDAGLSN